MEGEAAIPEIADNFYAIKVVHVEQKDVVRAVVGAIIGTFVFSSVIYLIVLAKKEMMINRLRRPETAEEHLKVFTEDFEMT